MTPKKMNNFLKALLVSIVILVALGLFFADKRLQNVSQKTVELKAQIEADNNKLAVYELTKAKVEELGYIEDIASQILPQSENQSVVVAELSEFAKRSNLQTGSITFNEDVKEARSTSSKNETKKQKVPQGVSIIPVTFTVSEEAPYEDLLSFLKYIEQNRRKMQITQISLTPSADDNGNLEDISISLNLFVKTEKESAE